MKLGRQKERSQTKTNNLTAECITLQILEHIMMSTIHCVSLSAIIFSCFEALAATESYPTRVMLPFLVNLQVRFKFTNLPRLACKNLASLLQSSYHG